MLSELEKTIFEYNLLTDQMLCIPIPEACPEFGTDECDWCEGCDTEFIFKD